MSLSKVVIPHIIEQHAEEAAFLWLLRHNAVTAPHYNLKDLAKLDNRVEAHLDGLRIAGDDGWEACCADLEHKEPGEIFAAGLLALEGMSSERIHKVYAVAEATPATLSGLISAFGWVEPQHLQGKVSGLLASNSALWRRVGIAACAIHRVNPGNHLEQAIQDSDGLLRARALRAAGELGRVDLKPLILEQINDQEAEVAFWAAYSAVRLGDRGQAVSVLEAMVTGESAFTVQAMSLLLRVLNLEAVKQLLKVLVQQHRLREAIMGVGIVGDPSYIPWLIKQILNPDVAKIAGESFSFITGVDIAYEDLDGELPEGFKTGPSENPEDEAVAMDIDEDLPCPDPVLIEQWWQPQQARFLVGYRYLSGKPIDTPHCQIVLKIAKQRQRQAAALELALLHPKTPLFETRAVGKQQQKLLV